MRKLIFLIAATFMNLLMFIPAATQSAHELPMGAYISGGPFLNWVDINYMDTMHNELGLNFIYPSYDSGAVFIDKMLKFALDTHKMKCIPANGNKDYNKYSHGHYLVIQAEDQQQEIRFRTRRGIDYVEGNYWKIMPVADTVLDSLFFRAEPKRVSGYLSLPITYYPFINLKIDTTGLSSSDTIGFLNIYCGTWWTSAYDTLIRVCPILAGPFFYSNPQIYSFPNFIIPDQVGSGLNSHGVDHLNFQVVTTGICTLWVDYLKMYDIWGKNLIEDHFFDQNIKRYTSPTNTWVDSCVIGWYLRDEPLVSQFLPYHYIDSIIADTGGAPATTIFANPVARTGHKQFIDIAKPQIPWFDLYPFDGGQITWDSSGTRFNCYDRTLYAGNASIWGPCGGAHISGLQFALNKALAYPADSIANLLKSYNPPKKWYFVPQTFAGRRNYNANDDWMWRLPTASEFSCEIFMGLCYGPAGLLFWRFDGYENTNDEHWKGLIDKDPDFNKTDIFYSQRDRVNPYIKAIDLTYMNLVWERAYICTTCMVNPGPLVHSIRAVSNTDDPNPDLGWFHIGEFSDEAGVPYVMIVNRACSQGPDTSAEAPEITAFINFNIYTSDDSAYIITDIAKGTNAGNWTGYSEITYSAPLNGSVPFTTTFKAGEGRLFKLEPVPVRNLPGLVTGDTIYQGGIRISSSIMVPDSNTMRIIAPAQVKVASGQGITVQGTLNVKGYESDTVKFIPANDTSWHGIHFRFHNSTGNFDYCKIEKVNNYGIVLDSAGLDDTIGIKLNHCVIQNTSYDPVYCYKSQATILNSIIDGNDNSYYGISNIKGKVKAVSSTIKGCEIYGLYADSAVTKLDSCLFENCWRYGIYSYGHPAGTYDSTLVTNCSIQRTSSPNPDSSQYGIYVTSNAKIRLANNFIRDAGQGGIRLSSCNAKVYSDIVRNVAYNGILGENGAIANVQNCILDTLNTGIYLTSGTGFTVRRTKFKNQAYGVRTWARPDLGTTRDPGNNNIDGCSTMFIYYSTLSFPPPALYAQYNYFGPGRPDSTKISQGVVYDPWLNNPASKRGINELTRPVYELCSNYPNPFNPQTAISFNLIEPAQTKVLIYNVLGQKIKTLVNEYLSPGQYSYIWDGRTDIGEDAASGVYLYRIESGSFVQTKKMTLIR